MHDLINQEDPLLVLSGEDKDFGYILNCNQGALKETCFEKDKLVGQHLNILIPSEMHANHEKILRDNIREAEKRKKIEIFIFLIQRTGYCKVFNIEVKYVNSTYGKRWIIKLTPLKEK